VSKQLRTPERIFHIVLWLVAVVFAGSLIGLGSLVEQDLPTVDPGVTLETYIDANQAHAIDQQIDALTKKQQSAGDAADRANVQLDAARTKYQSAKESFSNWVTTRQTTQQPSQDAELIARTRALDVLKSQVDTYQAAVEQIQSDDQANRKAIDAQHRARAVLEETARVPFERELRRQALKVFGIRLALTLPLLLIAAGLFVKKRRSSYWPFVWGFGFFAVFAFFVELVPYLPSYGGYVRYLVAIALTLVGGRYVILSMQRYLERQRQSEQQDESSRRRLLTYEHALKCSHAGVCPGCERSTKIQMGPTVDNATSPHFCMHCGMTLFNHCAKCGSQKNAFFHFCPSCGDANAVLETEVPAAASDSKL